MMDPFHQIVYSGHGHTSDLKLNLEKKITHPFKGQQIIEWGAFLHNTIH